MSGCGSHRTPRNDSNGGGVGKIALVILAAALLATPAEAAATTAAHVVAEVVKVTVIVLACLAAVAVATGLAVAAVRMRRRLLTRAQDSAFAADVAEAPVPSWPDSPALGRFRKPRRGQVSSGHPTGEPVTPGDSVQARTIGGERAGL